MLQNQQQNTLFLTEFSSSDIPKYFLFNSYTCCTIKGAKGKMQRVIIQEMFPTLEKKEDFEINF